MPPAFWRGLRWGILAGLVVGWAFFALPAHAETIGRILTDGGGVLEVYSDRGQCMAPARAAQWISADKARKVPGCWIAAGMTIQVAYIDGDAVQYDLRHLKAPEPGI